MTGHRKAALGLFVVASIGLGACAPDRAVAPQAGTPRALLGLDAAPAALECAPVDQARSATGVVTPQVGGTVSAGGITITVPAGAVGSSTTITVTAPQTSRVEARITANGQEHIGFQQTVLVQMRYDRCLQPLAGPRETTTSAPADAALTVWYVDPVTGAPVAQMPTVDDKLTHTVTFATNHLSGYSVFMRSDTTQAPE